MRFNSIDTAKLIFSVFLSLSFLILTAKAESLSEMVERVLESHEDIINSKKELEES